MSSQNSKKEPDNISGKELFKEFVNTVTDLERRFFKTLKDLLICPELVVDTYIRGDKKIYFPIFRFFLFSLVISLENKIHFCSKRLMI